MQVCVTYNTPPGLDTALSANAQHSAAVLRRHGYDAQAVPIGQIGHWEAWYPQHKPQMVIISATCVPLPLMRKLAERHRQTIWVQRIHSNSAFLFQESCAFDHCMETLRLARDHRNLRYAVVDLAEAQRWTLAGAEVACIPNVWSVPIDTAPRTGPDPRATVRLSAEFALRLLKAPASHLLAAAILNRRRPAQLHLQMHRCDCEMYPRNLKAMAELIGLTLVEEPYRTNDAFVAWLADTIHVGLQLSLTESFNYVALEHFAHGIPCVCGRAIGFSPWRCDPEDAEDAVRQIEAILADYPHASALALDAARRVAEMNETLFVDAVSGMIGRPA